MSADEVDLKGYVVSFNLQTMNIVADPIDEEPQSNTLQDSTHSNNAQLLDIQNNESKGTKRKSKDDADHSVLGTKCSKMSHEEPSCTSPPKTEKIQSTNASQQSSSFDETTPTTGASATQVMFKKKARNTPCPKSVRRARGQLSVIEKVASDIGEISQGRSVSQAQAKHKNTGRSEALGLCELDDEMMSECSDTSQDSINEETAPLGLHVSTWITLSLHIFLLHLICSQTLSSRNKRSNTPLPY